MRRRLMSLAPAVHRCSWRLVVGSDERPATVAPTQCAVWTLVSSSPKSFAVNFRGSRRDTVAEQLARKSECRAKMAPAADSDRIIRNLEGFRVSRAGWRSEWNSNPRLLLRISNLQIPECQRCHRCQECRGVLHAGWASTSVSVNFPEPHARFAKLPQILALARLQ